MMEREPSQLKSATKLIAPTRSTDCRGLLFVSPRSPCDDRGLIVPRQATEKQLAAARGGQEPTAPSRGVAGLAFVPPHPLLVKAPVPASAPVAAPTTSSTSRRKRRRRSSATAEAARSSAVRPRAARPCGPWVY
jgi:hypothetical protein